MLWVIILGLHYVSKSSHSTLFPQYITYIRRQIFGKTIDKHMENYQDLQIGKNITQLMDATRNMMDSLSLVMISIIPVIITATSIIIYLTYVNKKIGLLMISGFILIFALLYVLGKKSIILAKQREIRYFKLAENYNNSFSNLMHVYINNQTDNEKIPCMLHLVGGN